MTSESLGGSRIRKETVSSFGSLSATDWCRSGQIVKSGIGNQPNLFFAVSDPITFSDRLLRETSFALLQQP